MKSIGLFDFGKEIRNGSTSTIYSAMHREIKEVVAVKIYKIPEKNDENAEIVNQRVKDIKREIAILKEVSHPCICELFDVVKENDYKISIIFEYAEGENLLEFINRTGNMNELLARDIFIQLMSTLLYLHTKNIIHRDIKLENIIIDENRRIKLMDFAYSYRDGDHDQISKICGSVPYASPEMIRKEKYTSSIDIWSAGVVLYAMVTGQLPFVHEDRRQIIQKILFTEPPYPSDLSPQLIDLLPRLLCKDHKSRINEMDCLSHPWVCQQSQNPCGIIQSAANPSSTSSTSKISAATNSSPSDNLMGATNVCHRRESSDEIDTEVIDKLGYLGYDRDTLLSNLLSNDRNDATIAYRILKRKKIESTDKTNLRMRRMSNVRKPNVGSFTSNGSAVFSIQTLTEEVELNSVKPSMRKNILRKNLIQKDSINSAGSTSNASNLSNVSNASNVSSVSNVSNISNFSASNSSFSGNEDDQPSAKSNMSASLTAGVALSDLNTPAPASFAHGTPLQTKGAKISRMSLKNAPNLYHSSTRLIKLETVKNSLS